MAAYESIRRQIVGCDPCVGCSEEKRCGTEALACDDFRHYVQTGEARLQNRNASASLYRAISRQDGNLRAAA